VERLTARTAARPRTWLKVLLTVVVLLLVAMWVYAFVFAPRSGVNRVEDPAWTSAAKARCETAGEALEPYVFRTRITDPTQAELTQFVANLDEAAAIFDGLLDDLEALPRTSEKSRSLVPQWLTEYRRFVTDVREWTAELRGGRLVEFSVSKTENNIPIDERINTFATENRIEECRTDHLDAAG